MKQDNPLNPDFPGLSSGTHARRDAALGACVLSHRLLGIGAESAVPGPGGWLAKEGVWVREGGEGSVRCWWNGGGGWCGV